MKKIMIVVLIMILSACAPPGGYQDSTEDTGRFTIAQVMGEGIFDGTILVIHDDELNVTCWWKKAGYAGGLSCIPDYLLEE